VLVIHLLISLVAFLECKEAEEEDKEDNKRKKAKPIAKECKITLEDVYLGKMIKLPITR